MIETYDVRTYKHVTRHEAKLSGKSWDIPSATEMANTTRQILEVAKASLVLRSYNICYGIIDSTGPFDAKETRTAARESDGGHTNLMMAIVDRALSCIYGPDIQRTSDGYSYREVMEAIRRHDLPENVTGDTADDGNRDEAAKREAEQNYQKWFSHLAPSRESDFSHNVSRLLAEMEGKTSPTGKLLYVADKASAIIMTLCYDSKDLSPLRYPGDVFVTERDLAEMELCDFQTNHDGYYASEMWTIDYLKTRGLVKYDDTGYFTALIVMATLAVNGVWYHWREKDYR